MTIRACLLVLLLLLAGCETARPNLPAGESAYGMVPAASTAKARSAYLIGPLDTLAVTVFQEPDLSVPTVQIDSAGRMVLPLIGQTRAAGLSTTQLSHELERLFGARYLENPQVTVTVLSSASQHVTVEGSVNTPGVYEIAGPTSLIGALALARGPTQLAKLDEVVVFREIGGQRMGAQFDLAAIRTGRMADPEIKGGDTVVVGLSRAKSLYRDFLSTVPLIAIFRPFN